MRYYTVFLKPFFRQPYSTRQFFEVVGRALMPDTMRRDSSMSGMNARPTEMIFCRVL
ncbi:hypothetical protein MIS45_05360 [Wielerella bovis]|uniref:hypothetical protein n=1 Tax=Wielerella bovis TaxID=2917790 RepID=UPI0020198956|nr:hypothetical protein [Wielerella bovis]ULJ63483.1 hypothetical protein MIS46_05405 [Wielerella bovis]ULJ70252.1 hypothetical protein MIS45_05360 [Wielerella bovis]